METGEPDERPPAEREAPDDLRVTPLDGAAPGGGHPWLSWRWGLRLGGLVAVVTLFAVIAVALGPVLPRSVVSPPPPDVLALDLSPDLRFCATNGYWSPDGRRIAVPRAPTCGSSGAGASNLPDIYIYDAESGAQITAYTIMPAIQEALARANLSGAQVNYTGVAWSPDQRTLAAQFDVIQAFPQVSSAPFRARAGVALIALAGPHPGPVSALISPRQLSQAEQGSGFTPGPLTVDEWDTLQLSARQLDLPQALGYEWLPGDLLIATGQPPAKRANAAPTLTDTTGSPGNPIDGQRFSMWRTGELIGVNAVDCERNSASAPASPRRSLTVLHLSTVAWSPDGRYLLMISLEAKAPQTALPNAETPFLPFCLSEAAASAVPQAPIHDQAMRAALDLLGGAVSHVALLWSPDGARMAALPFEDTQASNTITLYDTATGAALTRIPAGPSQIPGAQGSDANASFVSGAWSPDGQRLLTVVAGQRFNIHIYGPHALG